MFSGEAEDAFIRIRNKVFVVQIIDPCPLKIQLAHVFETLKRCAFCAPCEYILSPGMNVLFKDESREFHCER